MPYFKKSFSLHLTDLKIKAMERQFKIYFWDLYWLDQSTPNFCWPRRETTVNKYCTEGRNTIILNVNLKNCKKQTRGALSKPSAPSPGFRYALMFPFWGGGVGCGGEVKDVTSERSHTLEPGGCSKPALWPCYCNQMVLIFAQHQFRVDVNWCSRNEALW